MMPRSLRKLLVLAALTAPLLGGSAAMASTYQVNPVRLELGSSARSGLLTIKNESQETLRFQVTAYAWSEAADGQMVLAPTQDIVFFPSMLSLKPGESRKIRVGAPSAAAGPERTYRIIVEELPPLGKRVSNAVRVLTRMSIPIFLGGRGAPRPALEGLTSKGDRLAFTVKNTGGVRFVAKKIRVRALDASGAELAREEFSGWYVLAGGERRYDLALPSSACAASKLVVSVETDGGSVESSVLPSGRACGR